MKKLITIICIFISLTSQSQSTPSADGYYNEFDNVAIGKLNVYWMNIKVSPLIEFADTLETTLCTEKVKINCLDSLATNTSVTRVVGLTNNGTLVPTSVSSINSLTIGYPSSNNTFTSGTAFQPDTSKACAININSILSGSVGVNGTVIIAISSTQNGTYTNVSTDRLLISIDSVTADHTSSLIAIPKGAWIKITLTEGITATYTKWVL